MVLLSRLERVTVQSRIGNRATAMQFDQRIDWYEGIAMTLLSRKLTLAFRSGRALTVGQIGALPDLDNVTIRIADVAADLAVLRDRPCNELRSSTFP